MAFTQPLSLDYWLVNTLSGGEIIFITLAIITMAIMAANFRMTNTVTLIMMMLFFIMMSPFIGLWTIVPLIVIGSILALHAISKIWE